MSPYFISYSRLDASDFAIHLADTLTAGPPPIPTWIDRRNIRPGTDWDESIVEALRQCRGLIFVMTNDSVMGNSGCKLEWARALQYKKTIIPLRLHDTAELPFRLGSREYIDFVGDEAPAVARLRSHLAWMDTAEGAVQALRVRLEDAQRELPRADSQQRGRIQDEISELQRQLAERERQLADPKGEDRRAHDRLINELNREREPPQLEKRVRFINPPPAAAPSWFQDRHVETGAIGTFIKDPAQRLMTVVGRAGIGKTAMVCRLLGALESGQLPDDGGALHIDGIVYLSATGSRRVRFDHLFADLSQLLTEDAKRLVEGVYKEAQTTVESKMEALAGAFPSGRTIVLLDNFEDIVDAVSGDIVDSELERALTALLTLPQHGIKVIITTRIVCQKLSLVRPERQRILELDTGLPSPYAENILREMDRDGKAGLRDAADSILEKARLRTRGYPRALEALYAILAADRDSSVEEVLRNAEELLPENVVQVLVGEAFSRLDPLAQRVMQALAIYGYPVPAAAVDLLLQGFQPGIDSAPVLKRLVNMLFARRESGRYYLHQEDRAYALARIDEGKVDDWRAEPPSFTRHSLRHRGAEYFRQIRRDPSTWESLADLGTPIAEFELLAASGDGEAALIVLDTMMPYLQQWGHYRRIARLASRLMAVAKDSIRSTAAGYAGEASAIIDENATAIASLRIALEWPDIAASQKNEWRLTIADCAERMGDVPQAEREFGLLAEEATIDVDRKIRAHLGLGRALESQYLNEEAKARYLEALKLYTSCYALRLAQNEDSISVTSAELAPGARYEEPDAWEFIRLETAAGQHSGEIIEVFGIQIDAAAAPEPDTSDPAAAQTVRDGDGRAFALINVTPLAATIWLRLAGLYSGTDQISEAVACCRLAVEMYQALDLDFVLGKARALDFLGRLTAQVSEAEAQEIREELGMQLERGIERARNRGDRRSEDAALSDYAEWCLDQRQWERAEGRFLELSRRAEEVEDGHLLARAELGLAKVERMRGRPREAIKRLERLLRDHPQDLQMQTDVAMELASIAGSEGRREDATKYYVMASRGAAAFGRQWDVIQADRQLALLASDRRDYEDAVQRLEAALAASRAFGVASLVTSVLCDLAIARSRAGYRAKGIEIAEEAQRVASRIELRATKAEALLAIGDVRTDLREFDRAKGAYEEAGRIFEDIGNRYNQYAVQSRLAWLYNVTRERDAQLAAARRALNLVIDLDDSGLILDAKGQLAPALSDCGQYEEAIRVLEDVIAQRPNDGRMIGTMGWILYQAGQYDRSLERSREAMKVDPSQTWIIRNLGHAYLAKGMPDDAEREYRRAIRDRRGGEDFTETIHVVKTLLARNPAVPRGQEMLDLLEREQQRLEGSRK